MVASNIIRSCSVLLLWRIASSGAFTCLTKTTTTRQFSINRRHVGNQQTLSSASLTRKYLKLHSSFSAGRDDSDDDENEDIPSIFAASSPAPFSTFPYGDPMNQRQEAAELKAALTEVINDKIAEDMDDIRSLRAQLQLETQQQTKIRSDASNARAQQQSVALLNKIDAMTSEFLTKTEMSRTTTKLAAAADQNMQGKRLQHGVWGTLGGGVGVLLGDDNHDDALIGSVQFASSDNRQQSSAGSGNGASILVIADVSSDEYARKILPLFTEQLQAALPNVKIQTLAPTATIPVGGNDAQCILYFATSLSDASYITKSLDRVMQKTLRPGGGSMSVPPSQLVLVSTIGTQRTNQMPYSMQNMFGGKLEKRRLMEEALVTWMRNYDKDASNTSNDASSNSKSGMVGLDYTICKFGELKDAAAAGPLQMAAGDAFEGTVDVASAAKVLLQAIAYQPSARNTTFSVVGSLPESDDDDAVQDVIDDAFLRLDGPELLRIDLPGVEPKSNYEQLAEYIREWAELFAASGKGMTTPIRYRAISAQLPRGVVQQQACQLVFVATATGKNYMSKEEEREREAKGIKKDASTLPPARLAKEGGVEFVIEVTKDDSVRVRAKRCNYARDATIKELSESTILSRFKDCIDVWKKDHLFSK
ncbi:hypothetical protein MPSEU_000112400 [Mayamaea pseudoterrestris]|nr:hypothetical protein MPSEU_000112400 [Mayamaea pseudoterrestris]